MKPAAVGWWHTGLRAVALLNIALWCMAALAVTGEHTAGAASGGAYLQLILSAGYVAGCAFQIGRAHV